MQLTSLLLAASAALSVIAAPQVGSGPGGLVYLPTCQGDMEYDPFDGKCKCDKGEYYDANIKRCRVRDVKEFSVRRCREGEHLYCARDEGDYIKYDPQNPLCWDDNTTRVFCARKNKVSEVFRAEIRRDYEIETFRFAEEDYKHAEYERKQCKPPRHYNYETKACECPHNKVWDGHDCGFPILPKPNCQRHEEAYCAKDEYLIVKYTREEKLCQDNGKNYVFCCAGKKGYREEETKAYREEREQQQEEVHAKSRSVGECAKERLGYHV